MGPGMLLGRLSFHLDIIWVRFVCPIEINQSYTFLSIQMNPLVCQLKEIWDLISWILILFDQSWKFL